MSSLRKLLVKRQETQQVRYVAKSGVEFTLFFPAKASVCWQCRGKGTRVNPAIDEHGISPDEFRDDPEFRDAYFSGRYDVTCDECKGERVLWDADETHMSKFQRILLESAWAQLAQDAAYAREVKHEREMGY